MLILQLKNANPRINHKILWYKENHYWSVEESQVREFAEILPIVKKDYKDWANSFRLELIYE